MYFYNYRTDDPVADAARRDEAETEWLRTLPKCCSCGEPITGDELYDIAGDLFCQDCLDREFKKYTDQYIKED